MSRQVGLFELIDTKSWASRHVPQKKPHLWGYYWFWYREGLSQRPESELPAEIFDSEEGKGKVFNSEAEAWRWLATRISQ